MLKIPVKLNYSIIDLINILRVTVNSLRPKVRYPLGELSRVSLHPTDSDTTHREIDNSLRICGIFPQTTFSNKLFSLQLI